MTLHTILVLKEFVRAVRCTASISYPCKRCKSFVVDHLKGIDLQTEREIVYRPNQVLSQFPHTSTLVGKPCTKCNEYCVPLQTTKLK